MKKILISIITLLGLFIIAGCNNTQVLEVKSFEDCVEAGNLIMESYPRQCRHEGILFVEELENEIEDMQDYDGINQGLDDNHTLLNNTYVNQSLDQDEDENIISEKHYCDQDAEDGFCTQEYDPVCGWSDETIKCLKYPCAQTYSNSCHACFADNVKYWTKGECPE